MIRLKCFNCVHCSGSEGTAWTPMWCSLHEKSVRRYDGCPGWRNDELINSVRTVPEGFCAPGLEGIENEQKPD